MRYALLALATALALPATAPAIAAPPTEVRVAYGDLDLRDPGDVRSLERRVARAVRAACTPPVALAPTPQALACRADGMAQAQREIARHRARHAVVVVAPGG